MKNTLFEITKQEKNRILEMHKSATIKQYLMEGDLDSRKTLLEILKVSDEITKKIILIFQNLLIMIETCLRKLVIYNLQLVGRL